MKFIRYIIEAASHTDKSDVNEILYGLYMADGSWSVYQDSAYIQKQLEAKKSKLTDEDYFDEEQRAIVMAQETKNWMKKNGYSNVVKVWWTARPGVLSNAVGKNVDSSKNPTDILVQTRDGAFLGLSAKSTKGKGDIGFKNPGTGTIEKALGLDFSVHEKSAVEALLTHYPDVPISKGARKGYVRKNPDVQEMSSQLGWNVLGNIRDDLLSKFNGMGQEDLRTHLIEQWMDAGELFPYYIKVTGHGKGGRYSATITDPNKSEKTRSLSFPIEAVPLGDHGIGITANKIKIMKIRSKYESEKLSSSIKFSGEPW